MTPVARQMDTGVSEQSAALEILVTTGSRSNIPESHIFIAASVPYLANAVKDWLFPPLACNVHISSAWGMSASSGCLVLPQ
jgi:hypothetical protein